jgi:DNA processing protein
MTPGLENFLRLYTIKGIGLKFLQRFYNTFGTFEGNLEEKLKLFAEREKISAERLNEILKLLEENKEFKLLKEFVEKYSVGVIPFYDNNFPKEVLDLGINIPTLFVIGNFDPSNGFSVVGTRNCDLDGRIKAFKFGEALAQSGYTVISGGAIGVDLQAHKGALSVGGKTGVIIGEGLYTYLKRNKKFAEEVLKKDGFILSQFNPFSGASKWTFPQRNALIAYYGFFGTLIVQAPEKSGALITADYALRLKRPLYAYIGCTFNPKFGGCVGLVEEGKARLVSSPERLLEFLGSFEKKEKPAEGGNNSLENLLKEKPRTFDELLALSGLSEDWLLEKLTEFELEGKIKLEGGYYSFVDG